MAIPWFAYVILLVHARNVQASDMDDFSNNLATDIGPLIALFGGGVTTQYLSESTAFLDYIIFALAPIGIVTAMVSAIRVCGGSALRAFIGRAQEGEGEVEAELCTSTGRDVCELFNRGGITRVLGRPQILEVVQVPGDPMRSSTMGIYLFRERLRSLSAGGVLKDWEIVQKDAFAGRLTSILRKLRLKFDKVVSGRAFGRSRPMPLDEEVVHEETQKDQSAPKQNSPMTSAEETEDGQPEPSPTSRPFVQNPNLSINVVIVKQPPAYFYAVAIVGCILQGGVIAMAGVLSWKFQWTHDGAPNELVNIATIVSTNREPMAFIIGTVALCTGMFWCAALVGQITEEEIFRRTMMVRSKPQSLVSWLQSLLQTKDLDSQPRSRLFWLQPGNQVIGDQTFDAFAYAEDPKNPLQEYTTSRKKPRDKYTMYTWGAVVLTLGGYIAQFVGLRGMNAWISIAQVAATVVMSFLRAVLRMQRLDAGANQLGDIPDKVAGHELDWLTFELAKNDTGVHEKAGGQRPHLSWRFTGRPASATSLEIPIGSLSAPQVESDSAVKTLLRYRCRLAHLTGHHAFPELMSWGYQQWPDERVRVRSKARDLANALCATAEVLLADNGEKKSIKTPIEVAMSCSDGRIFVKESIELTMESSNGGNWRIDSAQLEGILGLWLWSMMSIDDVEEEDEHGTRVTIANKFDKGRIVSACRLEDQYDLLKDVQREFDLWAGQNAFALSEYVLDMADAMDYDSTALWSNAGVEPNVWKPSSWKASVKVSNERNSKKLFGSGKSTSQKAPKNETWKRFFGWGNVPGSIFHTDVAPLASTSPNSAPHHIPPAQDARAHKIRVQFVQMQNRDDSDLLRESVQDLYASILSSIVGVAKPNLGETTSKLVSSQIRLSNAKATAAVAAFTENGLGSHSEALATIIPALRAHLRPPEGDAIIPSLLSAAADCRISENWEAAEMLIQWACAYYTPKKWKASDPNDSFRDNNDCHSFSCAIIALGELYRWALRVQSRSLASATSFGNAGIRAMLESFRAPVSGATLECKRVLDRYRDIATIVARTNNIDIALPPPVLEHDESNDFDPRMLSGGSDRLLQCIQEGKRTETLCYLCFISAEQIRSRSLPFLASAAQKRWSEVVMALLDYRLSVDDPDDDGRSALSHFAEAGNTAMVKALLDKGGNPNQQDKLNRTLLWWAAGSGQVAIVKLLLSTGVDANAPDDGLRTPLSRAAEKGYRNIAQVLLSDNSVRVDSADSTSRTPLSWAAGCGHEDVVGLLIRLGAVTTASDENGRIPLFHAAGAGHLKTVERLLATAPDGLRSKDCGGHTPLIWASRNGRADVVRFMLLSGYRDMALASKSDSTARTALWWAARNGHAETVSVLLGSGQADPDAKDTAEQTPLMWAVRNSHKEVVELLLKTGKVNADACDLTGRTPLIWAARYGDTAIVKLLLTMGKASPDIADDDGRSALSWAAAFGHEEIVRLLVGTGKVNVHAEDDNGLSPFAWAMRNKQSSILKILDVDHGA
jgi:ankyrin repeat protein